VSATIIPDLEHIMDKKKLRRGPLYLALTAALTVVLGACTSSGGSSSDPSSQNNAAGGSSPGTQAGIAQFAQCMRQNGVSDFPDPQNGHFVMPGDIQSNPHFHPAFQACQHYLGASVNGGANTGSQSAMLAFTHCMQTNGVPSYPDPDSNGALVAPPASVRNSPSYAAAYNKCKSKLPGGGTGSQG
jgi:hypothetical protein